MDKEYIRRKRIADLSQEFSEVTNGMFDIIRYKENRDKDGKDLLLVSIPLKEHPIYGETKIYIRELYDENGEIEYHYGWEKTKGSKHGKHISAWGMNLILLATGKLNIQNPFITITYLKNLLKEKIVIISTL